METYECGSLLSRGRGGCHYLVVCYPLECSYQSLHWLAVWTVLSWSFNLKKVNWISIWLHLFHEPSRLRCSSVSRCTQCEHDWSYSMSRSHGTSFSVLIIATLFASNRFCIQKTRRPRHSSVLIWHGSNEDEKRLTRLNHMPSSGSIVYKLYHTIKLKRISLF